jgi:hypothetical protein
LASTLHALLNERLADFRELTAHVERYLERGEVAR